MTVRRGALLLTALSLTIVGLALTDRGEIINFVLSKFSPNSESIAIRMGHIDSILGVLSTSIWTLLFGSGVGSTFYSVGTNSIVGGTEYAVEVSYFDLVRQFGLLYGLALTAYCIVLVLAVRRTDATGRLLALSIVILFLAASTNPLLISPVFFLVLVISRAYVTVAKMEARSYTSVQLATRALE